LRIRLVAVWEDLRSSYWFVPATMALLAILLSFITIAIDRRVQYDWVREVGFIWSGGAEGARSLLSTVTGSVITVAGVVFSITLTALSLASQQLGPRLLRNFMRDTGNQIVLGTFVATFVYGVLVLRTVRGGDTEFVPYVSVTIAILLTLASLAVLIYFFHHASLSIQAPLVIGAVAEDLHEAIDRLFPEELGKDIQAIDRADRFEDCEEARKGPTQAISAFRSGYLQAVDQGALLEVAVEHRLLLTLLRRPGQFVGREAPLVQVHNADLPGKEIVKDIRGAFIIGRQRTTTQDVEFAIEQLVEVAVRSLSPGINDPYTAITCIDWLGTELAHLARRQFPSACRYDDAGQLRIVVEHPVTFSSALATAFDQIRQNAASNVAVRVRLLEALALIAPHVTSEAGRTALMRQAKIIWEETLSDVPVPEDRRAIERRFLTLAEMLDSANQS